MTLIHAIIIESSPYVNEYFQLLLEYIPQIKHRWALLRDQLQNMQAKAENSEIESTADTPSELKTLNVLGDERTTKTSNHSDDYQEEKSKHDLELANLSERVSHLRCLLDFIQTESDLQRILSLREQVQAGSLETIRFPDIWLLFRPGDLVVTRANDHWRLRKVYSTTGGQVQRKARGKYNEYDFAENRGPGKRACTGATNTVEEDGTERFLRQSNFGIGSWTPLKVDCYTLNVIGDELRPIDGLWKIKHFLGEMRITDLPIYPLRFHPDTDGLLKRMEERGLKFLMSPGHKSYTGPSARSLRMEPIREIDGDVYVEATTEDNDESDLVACRVEVTETQEEVNGAIRLLLGDEVDTKCSEEFMSANRLKLDAITIEKAKGSAEYLTLLPWVVNAYVFRLRHWGKYEEAAVLSCWQPKIYAFKSWRIQRGLTTYTENLDVDLIQEIDRGPEARDLSFNELVIPEKNRTLLVSLVEDHASKAKARWDSKKMTDAESPRPQVDLVRGKGQGLIILLHGPPGSGKTSTAETIAAYTQRPLYSITCGDLGLNATDVEENLSRHTRRAEKWGCVLLLDEADVFLMQRNWQDMERNALVSGEMLSKSLVSKVDKVPYTQKADCTINSLPARVRVLFRYSVFDNQPTWGH